MLIQSGSKSNIDVLKNVPYATLIRAMVSCFVLISIGTACLSSAGEEKHGNDMFISACLLGILAVLGYTLTIYCLCGLLDLSDKFRMTLILLLIAVISCCMGILARSMEIYQNTYGQQQAAKAVEASVNIIYIVERIFHATALYVFMNGLADVLKTGSNNKLAGHIDILGKMYLASVIILHIVTSITFTKSEKIGTYCLLVSMLIWTLLETVIFFTQRRATMQIWQDHNDRSRARQFAPKAGRG